VQLLQRFGAPDRQVFKKIDSTLRGHPAMEIAAMCKLLAGQQRAAPVVFAPAFPAMGRTTRDGHVFVHGTPLEETETWKREHGYPSADLAAMLASAGIAAMKVPLAHVRAGAKRLQDELRAIAQSADGLVAVCDAETDADLDSIAGAARAPGSRAFLIGAAGLAHAVARAEPETARAPLALRPSTAGALVVVGSLASVSRQAARALAAQDGVMVVHIGSALLLDTRRREYLGAYIEPATAALQAGRDVLVEVAEDVAPALERGHELVRALAWGLAPALGSMSGLVVTGGETAAALLTQQFVDQIELRGEIEVGVVLGLARGPAVFPMVTKPGAFGDAGSLVRALEKLRQIRRTGVLE
jgi:uncharacterized protein YgbK (DUF1537 family)